MTREASRVAKNAVIVAREATIVARSAALEVRCAERWPRGPAVGWPHPRGQSGKKIRAIVFLPPDGPSK